MAKDPVCDMDVDEETSTIKTDYKGTTYHFCSEECKEIFQTDPERHAQHLA